MYNMLSFNEKFIHIIIVHEL